MQETVWETLAQWSEIVGALAFVVVAVVLFRRLVLPMIERATVAKNAELVGAEEHRATLRIEVDAARERLAEADRDAASIASRAIIDAEHERTRIVSDARNEGARLVANAQGELGRARIAARDRLRIELIERALVRAREIATAKFDDAANNRLVTKTVDDVVAEQR